MVHGDEYYYSGRESGILKTDEEYAQALDAWLSRLFVGEGAIYSEANRLKTIIDPSAASFIALLRKRKRYRVISADNAVLDGIRETATCLQIGKIKVSPKCENWLKEVQGYVWDEGGGEDRPVKMDDHSMDQMRYFCKTLNIAKPKNTIGGGIY